MFEARLHPKEPLNRSRIAGFVIALTLHLGAFIWVTAYVSDDIFSPGMDEDISSPVEFIKPIKPIISPPSLNIKSSASQANAKPKAAIINKKSMPVIQTALLQDSMMPVAIQDELKTEASETTEYFTSGASLDGNGNGNGNGSGSGSDDEITIFNLKPKHHPSPDYPRHSVRNGEHGTIVVLVKVDAEGIPIEARILKSSGYKILDEETKRNILAKWRYHPAMRQGVPIPAYTIAKQIYIMDGHVN
jgi:TonB family protein